jgi:hypothetical protein
MKFPATPDYCFLFRKEGVGNLFILLLKFGILLLMRVTKRPARDSYKETSVSESHAVLDLNTGEISPIIETKGRKKHVFPGGWVFVGVVYITKLFDVRLSADGYRLALLLMREAGWEGVCDKPFAELARMMNVHPPRLSKLMGDLERVRIVYRVGGKRSHAVLLNPAFCWRGSAEEQHRALEAWAKYHPIGIVRNEFEIAS